MKEALTILRGEGIEVRHEVSVRLPTENGEFVLHLYTDDMGKDHVALVMGSVEGGDEVLTRVHSECLTGDLFGSLRCDCRSQLVQSMRMIAEEGEGAVIYLRQEGRGIGLLSKLHSYNLQDRGLDTVDANVALGYDPDIRDYEVAALILRGLGISSIRLLSNNPDKFRSLRGHGVRISSRVPLSPRVSAENIRYLRTKASRMDHLLDLDAPFGPERERVIRRVRREMDSHGGGFITLFIEQSLNGGVLEPQDDLAVRRLREGMRSCHDAYMLEMNGHRPSYLLDSLGGEARPMVLVHGRLERDDVEELEREFEIVSLENGENALDRVVERLGSVGARSLLVEAPSLMPALLASGRLNMLVSCTRPLISPKGGAAMPPARLTEADSVAMEDIMVTFGQVTVDRLNASEFHIDASEE